MKLVDQLLFFNNLTKYNFQAISRIFFQGSSHPRGGTTDEQLQLVRQSKIQCKYKQGEKPPHDKPDAKPNTSPKKKGGKKHENKHTPASMCWEPNRGVITFCTNICCAISFEGDDKISGLSFQIRRSWPFSHCSEPGATFLEAFCMRSTFPTYKCRMPNGEVFCKKTSNDERGEGKTVRIEEKIRCKQEQD